MAAFLAGLFTLTSTQEAKAQYAQERAEIIREIRVDGAQRIDPATVLSYLEVEVGEPGTSDTLNQALKNLYATGLFADVTLRQDRGVLVVSVTENPIINQVAFEGNDEITDAELQAEISLRSRQVFTKTKIQNDLSRLYEIYRRTGRFSAEIEPKIIELDQNRVNLVFEIIEGSITRIKGIRFIGNEAFTDDALRAELATKEDRWYRLWGSSDRYDPDRIEFDRDLLRRFYRKEGYADFRVVSANAELAQGEEDFFLTFNVEEGERYAVNTITINSELRGFDGAVLREDATFLPGQWYNADEVQNTIEAMTDSLGDRQYAFVDIRPSIKRNSEEATLDIAFNINESPRVFIEKIDINGNLRTLDRVVRRQITLAEGDPFSRVKLAESEQNIRDLDYFEIVEVNTIQGSAPDLVVVDVRVVEQSTGELSIGAGFSTNEGPLADLRIRERNLLGKGQDLLFATTVAGERTQFDISFTEPFFMDRNLSAGVDAFRIERDLQDESSFDQKQTGGAFRIGYPLSDKWRQTWRYRLEDNEITDVGATASIFIQNQEGKRITSLVGQSLTYNDLDSRIFPTEGLTGWINTDVAGFGGDARYVSTEIGANYYIPVYKKKVIFDILGEVGAIGGFGDEDVQINERFYLGGNDLRGFEQGGIGPRDAATEDALGGNYYYRGSAEFKFPIGLPEELGVAGHAFSDFGTLWELDDSGAGIQDENSIRISAGLGLSWRSPLGPVRVDVAQPVVKESFDKEEVFRFSFGTRF
ncbi:MAG: outer membrane protein assembly factor BamA [Pseudomonadota bacterium]